MPLRRNVKKKRGVSLFPQNWRFLFGKLCEILPASLPRATMPCTKDATLFDSKPDLTGSSGRAGRGLDQTGAIDESEGASILPVSGKGELVDTVPMFVEAFGG